MANYVNVSNTTAQLEEHLAKIAQKLTYLKFIDSFEYYLVPICFLFGSIGNLTSSICLLRKHHTRKRTSFFMLAAIGFADTLFLLTQLHRWSMVFYEARSLDFGIYGLCRFYYMFIKCAMLLSITIQLALASRLFIGMFFGAYRLSMHSCTGQIFSRLCVAYTIALVLSASWHGLYTSGTHSDNSSLSDDSTRSSYEICNIGSSSTNVTSIQRHLKCQKNAESILVVDVLNYFYFSICLLFYAISLLACVSMWVKINLKILSKFLLRMICCSIDDEKNRQRMQRLFNFITAFNSKAQDHEIVTIQADSMPKTQRMSSVWEIGLDETTLAVNKALSHKKTPTSNFIINKNTFTTSLAGEQPEYAVSTTTGQMNDPRRATLISRFSSQSVVRIKPLKVQKECKPRKFTKFILIMWVVCAIFDLPYIFFDTFLYDNVDVERIYQQVNDTFMLTQLRDLINVSSSPNDTMTWSMLNSTLTHKLCIIDIRLVHALKRLPLILVNISHMLKFYFLFIIYSRFRQHLSLFLHIRFYVNSKLAKQIYTHFGEHADMNVMNDASNEQQPSSQISNSSARLKQTSSSRNSSLVRTSRRDTLVRADASYESPSLVEKMESIREKNTSHSETTNNIDELANGKTVDSNLVASMSVANSDAKNENESNLQMSNRTSKLTSNKQTLQTDFEKTFTIKKHKFKSIFLLHSLSNPFKLNSLAASSQNTSSTNMVNGVPNKSSIITSEQKRQKWRSDPKRVCVSANATYLDEMCNRKASLVKDDEPSKEPSTHQSQQLFITTSQQGRLNNNKNNGQKIFKSNTCDNACQKNGLFGHREANTRNGMAHQVRKKLTYNEKLSKMLIEFESDDEDESSSIVGFRSYPSIQQQSQAFHSPYQPHQDSKILSAYPQSDACSSLNPNVI